MSELMNTATTLFGNLPDGIPVSKYAISNSNGIEMDVIDYGATITSLRIPVKDSKTDIVLGFDTAAKYANSFLLPSPPYFGAVVGRWAGRIKKGKFSINGKHYQLDTNNAGNSLHGGHSGFSQKMWTVQKHEDSSISMIYVSPHGEENFPGELTVEVQYTLTNSNELVVTYKATASKDTIINLTQHSYFNLDGHTDDLSHHKLCIRAAATLQTEDMIPTGKLASVDGTEFDFRTKKDCPLNIDTTFVLSQKPGAIAELSSKSGLRMRVFTDQPALHIYVGGNCFDQLLGKEGAKYHQKSGICFETQNFPDAPNHSNFPNAVLKAGETYKQKTIFQFDII